MLTIQDIIDKRRRIWSQKKDLDLDKALVRASAVKILSTPSLVAEVQAKPFLLIEVAFYIVNKKRETVPFFLNEVQRDFVDKLETLGTSKPFFILKGRQQGFTSVITAIQLSYAIVRKNFSGFTMADRSDNTMAIFNDKARVVYDRLPEELKPSEKFNSRNELFFDKLNSSWRIATATDQVGRSRTLNFVHFSEVAFYECSLADLQAAKQSPQERYKFMRQRQTALTRQKTFGIREVATTCFMSGGERRNTGATSMSISKQRIPGSSNGRRCLKRRGLTGNR